MRRTNTVIATETLVTLEGLNYFLHCGLTMKNRHEYSQYRNSPQLGLLGMQPLIIDNFAGGGGASTGLELALGRDVDIAINHDEIALSMHTINHPHTRHFCESVWDINPKEVTKGQPVGLAWFSPDCTHYYATETQAQASRNHYIPSPAAEHTTP